MTANHGKRSTKQGVITQRGFSLLEVMSAIVVLVVGLVGLLSVLGYAVSSAHSSQEDMLAKQLASEAIESIFTARQTTQVQWDQIENMPDGIFLNGFQPIHQSGADGIYGTTDDSAAPLRTIRLAGVDGILGTADDRTRNLTNFQREIDIAPVDGTDSVRAVTITIKYAVSTARAPKSYILSTYISQFR